jgi:uncharacterized RDD family membrane protein YckC
MLLDTVRRAETPEGLDLELKPAGVGARTLAYLYDFGIRIVLYFVLAALARLLGVLGPAFLLVGLFALEWFYPVVFELSPSGATPGKRAMGLQVVMDTGLPVTPAASVLRNLLRAADFVPALYGVGLLTMLWRPDFRRLGDIAAGTLVVYADPVAHHADIPAATPRPPARALTRREQAAVIRWAGRAKTLTPERLAELAALARPVLAGSPDAATDVTSLLGLAHWLLGRRPQDAS